MVKGTSMRPTVWIWMSPIWLRPFSACQPAAFRPVIRDPAELRSASIPCFRPNSAAHWALPRSQAPQKSRGRFFTRCAARLRPSKRERWETTRRHPARLGQRESGTSAPGCGFPPSPCWGQTSICLMSIVCTSIWLRTFLYFPLLFFKENLSLLEILSFFGDLSKWRCI